jgi:hypothetical protein
MRFKAFLTEGTEFSFDQVVEHIRSDCKEFLHAAQGKPFFRGAHMDTDGPQFFNHPAMRPAKDSDPKFNFMFNSMIDAAYDINMVRPRTLFGTGSYKQAQAYGDICYCFPAGPIRFLWSSEVSDSYEDDRNMYMRIMGIVNKEAGFNGTGNELSYSNIKQLFQWLSQNGASAAAWARSNGDAEQQTLHAFRYVLGEGLNLSDHKDELHHILIHALALTGSHLYQANTELANALDSMNEILIYKSKGFYMVPRDVVWDEVRKAKIPEIENRYDAGLYDYLLEKIRAPGA